MHKHHRGFTLIEIAIVVAVIAILTALTLVVYNNVQMQARDTKRLTDMRIITSQLKKYYDQNGEYPTISSSFMVNISKSGANDPTDNLSWNYMRDMTSSYCNPTTPRWGGGTGSLGPSCRNYMYFSGSNATAMSDNGAYGPGCQMAGNSNMKPYYFLGWYDESSKMIKFSSENGTISTSSTSTAFPGQVCQLTSL